MIRNIRLRYRDVWDLPATRATTGNSILRPCRSLSPYTARCVDAVVPPAVAARGPRGGASPCRLRLPVAGASSDTARPLWTARHARKARCALAERGCGRRARVARRAMWRRGERRKHDARRL